MADLFAATPPIDPGKKVDPGKLTQAPSTFDTLPKGPHDFITKVNNVAQAPLTVLGAGIEDLTKPGGIGMAGPALSGAVKQMRQGVGAGFEGAANRYSTTSLAANRARAQSGDPGAQWLDKHPTAFALSALAQSLGLGALEGKVMGPMADAMKAKVPAATMNRFGAVREAATSVGADPDQVEREFHTMSETQGPRAAAQAIVKKFYGGLTKAQQTKLFDTMQAGSEDPHLFGTSHAPAPETLPKGFPERLEALRAENRFVQPQLLKHGIAKPEQLLDPEHYINQSGALLSPDEEVNAQRAAAAAGKGTGAASRGIRKGTLAQERAYPTRQAGLQMGAQENPDWDPGAQLERHVAQRREAIQFSQSLDKLRELGLIKPKGEPIPPGWETLEENPDLKRFGSKLINEGASFHPAIAKGIRDVTFVPKSPEGLLPSVGHKLAQAGAFANYLASRFEVSNPGFHPVVNVGPNQLAQMVTQSNPLRSLPEYAKQLFAKKIEPSGGTAIPYASPINASEMTRPWPDLSPGEKLQRLGNLGRRAAEKTTSEPLYKHIEPRMSQASYRALQKGGVSEPKAALLTRQTVGEPENMPSSMRDSAQAIMFAPWRLAMGRQWPGLLTKNPGLYGGPHAAVSAYNLSRGVGPQPGDETKLIPAIAMGKNAQGKARTLSIPSPADIPLKAMDVLGAPFAGDTDELTDRAMKLGLSLANPLLNTGIRTAMTNVGAAGEPGTGKGGYRMWDRNNPSRVGQFEQFLGQAGGRYAPMRPSEGPLSGIGLDVETSQSPADYKHGAHLEHRMRAKIQKQMFLAQKAATQAAMDQHTAQATRLYNSMEQMMQKNGLQP